MENIVFFGRCLRCLCCFRCCIESSIVQVFVLNEIFMAKNILYTIIYLELCYKKINDEVSIRKELRSLHTLYSKFSTFDYHEFSSCNSTIFLYFTHHHYSFNVPFLLGGDCTSKYLLLSLSLHRILNLQLEVCF